MGIGQQGFLESLGAEGRVGIDVYRTSDLVGLDQALHTQEDLLRIPKARSFVAYNRIVTTGKRFIGNLIRGGFVAPTDVAVGTSATAPVDGDVALVSEVFKDAITQRIDIVDGVRIRFFLPSTSANGLTLREAGIFGPLPDVLMLARVAFADIAKTQSIAVNFSWDIVFSQP